MILKFDVGVDMVGYYEGVNFGIIWVNIFEDEFFMVWIFGFLVIDIFLYVFLVWYVLVIFLCFYVFY